MLAEVLAGHSKASRALLAWQSSPRVLKGLHGPTWLAFSVAWELQALTAQLTSAAPSICSCLIPQTNLRHPRILKDEPDTLPASSLEGLDKGRHEVRAEEATTMGGKEGCCAEGQQSKADGLLGSSGHEAVVHWWPHVQIKPDKLINGIASPAWYHTKSSRTKSSFIMVFFFLFFFFPGFSPSLLPCATRKQAVTRDAGNCSALQQCLVHTTPHAGDV